MNLKTVGSSGTLASQALGLTSYTEDNMQLGLRAVAFACQGLPRLLQRLLAVCIW